MRTLRNALGTVGVIAAIVVSADGAQGSVARSGNSKNTGILRAAYQHTLTEKSADSSINEMVLASSSGKSTTTNITGSGVSGLGQSQREASIILTLGADGSIDIRLVNSMIYMKLPQSLRSKLSGDKPWISINLAKLPGYASLEQLSNSSQAATDTLSYLQAVSQSGVSRVGTSTIRGVDTTEYSASIDLTKLVAKEQALKSELQTLENEIGTSTLPMDVWIDSSDRIRQLSFGLDVHPHGSTASASIKAQMDFYNFGATLNVVAPPAGQVEDLTGATGSTTS